MNTKKPRVIKDYDKLSNEIKEQIKLLYPEGYSQNLITYVNKDGLHVSALPFETEDKYYLIRMTVNEAIQIINDDDDYDDDGILKGDSKDFFEEKHSDLDNIADEE